MSLTRVPCVSLADDEYRMHPVNGVSEKNFIHYVSQVMARAVDWTRMGKSASVKRSSTPPAMTGRLDRIALIGT